MKIPKVKSVIRSEHVMRIIKGKSILHIGVGGATYDPALREKFLAADISSWFHSKIATEARHITTLEIDQENIDKYSQHIPGVYIKGDITDTDVLKKFRGIKFELIVFTEILEHLNNFHNAFLSIQGLLAPGGKVVITTPNAFSIFLFFKMLWWNETCHSEHTSYFSYVTIKRLLSLNDFQVESFMYCYDLPKATIWRAVKYIQAKILPQYSQGIFVVASRIN